MSKTVIIIDNEPYTKAGTRYFFVEEMITDVFEVKYFSLAKINLIQNLAIYPSYENNELTLYPESLEEFLEHLKKLPSKSNCVLEIEKNYQTKV